MSAAPRRLRIALVAPPLEAVPPLKYGGTERIVAELDRRLVERGHDVTVFASGDSVVHGRHVVTVARALRSAGEGGDPSGWFLATLDQVAAESRSFDLVHAHLDWWGLPLIGRLDVPVVVTFHGRIDLPYSRRLLAGRGEGLVAISRHQASTHPDVPWTVIHNGLSLDGMPFERRRGDDLCFVGRVDPEKGIVEAIEIAKATGRRLRIAAKVGTQPQQRAYHERVFLPALERAGSAVEYLGELGREDRDRLFAESYATLMPGSWPEPFGLVAIESMACGTPVLAKRVGAIPELVREGVDGFFGDDVAALAFYAEAVEGLDRLAIRERAIERFSADRMVDRHEELYARMVGRPYGIPAARAALSSAEQETIAAIRASLAAQEGVDLRSGLAASPSASPAAMPAAGPTATAEAERSRERSRAGQVLGRRPIARTPDRRDRDGR